MSHQRQKFLTSNFSQTMEINDASDSVKSTTSVPSDPPEENVKKLFEKNLFNEKLAILLSVEYPLYCNVFTLSAAHLPLACSHSMSL